MSRDALVVGISNYQFAGLSRLQAPAEDAEAIAKILEEYGDFNVWRLPEAIRREDRRPYVGANLDVTLARLKQELVRLFKPEGRSIPDTALFYFSGHGLRETQGIQEGFLATSDSNPDIGFYGLSLQWLRRLLHESPIRQQIVWLDCCHSGELLNFSEADPGVQGNGRDRCFIAASREFEVAYQDLSDHYSVLTKMLLEGLNPKREPQRWITNHSLTDYLNHYLRGATQRPTCSNFGEPINLTHTCEVVPLETSQDTASAICPYKGLEYFDCNDEDPKYFYGREELIDQLLDKLRQSNFLAIVGASGSGKSSVLRAGVIHQLQLGRKLAGSEQWQILILVPGDRPLQNLAAVFVEPNLPTLDRAEQLGRAEGLLKTGADGLRRLVQSSQFQRVVLVVDQFEEVFTLCQDDVERKHFISCLLGVLGQVGDQLCLIIAMRADFFSKCIEQEYSGLANTIKDNLVPVSPMNQEQLRQAIVKPVERANLVIEPELVEEMLRDVEGSPGSLPLLQYTLKELWQRRSNNRLQLTTYSQLGGISGTLDQRATEIFSQLPLQQQEVVKHIFLCLTQLGEGTEDTRRRVLKRDLITAKHPETLLDLVIHELADKKNRLIVTSELVEKRVAAERAVVVDVAHEALIRHWQKLRQWLDESRENLIERKKIEAAAIEWDSSQKNPSFLFQDGRLTKARDFQQEQRQEFPLSKVAEEFIQAGMRQQRQKKLKILVSFLALPLVGIGMWWAIWDLLGQVQRQKLLENRLSFGEDIFITPNLNKKVGQNNLGKRSGSSYFFDKDFKQAVNEFEDYLAVSSDDPEALIYLNNARVTMSKPLTIAVIVPIGANPTVAQEILRGVAQAQDEVNKTGGINGKPLQVKIGNDDNNPKIAREIAIELVRDSKILAVVGHNASDVSNEALKSYQGHLVMISPTSSTLVQASNKGFKSRNYIFRTTYDLHQVVLYPLANYIAKNIPSPELIICYDSRIHRPNSLSSILKKEKIKLAEVDCDFNELPNLYKVIKQATNKGANSLLLIPHVNTIDDAVTLAKINKSNKQPLKLFGIHTLYSSDSLFGENAVEGLIISVPWYPGAVPKHPFSNKVKKLWGENVGIGVTWRTAMAYDATKVIVEGLKKIPAAQTPTRERLQIVLSEPNFKIEGATGKVHFLPSGKRQGGKEFLVEVCLAKKSVTGYNFVPLGTCQKQ